MQVFFCLLKISGNNFTLGNKKYPVPLKRWRTSHLRDSPGEKKIITNII